MYRDAGYGENWQPQGNNARRINPYTRPTYILGCLFAVGFVLILIIVLSLIPIFIAQKSSTTTNNIQVAKVYIYGYTLQFLSPSNQFDPRIILSTSNNRLTLQAALTSMIQKDSTLTGSIIDTPILSSVSKRKRRQTFILLSITFNLNVTSSKACASAVCSSQFQAHVISQLSNINPTTLIARCETNETINSLSSSQIYWLRYNFPNTIKSNVSIAVIDPNTISSSLETLLTVDKTLNQPLLNTSITSTPTLIG